jgi:hypothetical protein
MKSIFNQFFLFSCLLVLGLSKAKASDGFRTGARVNLHLGTGFGIYNVSNNRFGDKDHGTLSGNFRFGADYGILPRFSVGAELFNNSFATNKDSNNSARLGGIGIYVHWNFGKKEKTTWYLHSGFGATNFVYEDFDDDGKATSTGSYFRLGLGFRRYFGDHFGLYSELLATGYNFNKFKYGDGQTIKTDYNNNFQVGLGGVEFRIGVCIAFGKNSD